MASMDDGPPDAAAVGVFPPAVPLATILLGIGLNRLWPLGPVPGFPDAPARYWVGGGIVLAAFLGLGLLSVVLMRRSGQSENPTKPTTSILTRGTYRLSRNPMYLQMVIGCIGFAVLLANLWILLLVPACAWALWWFAIRHEEAYLERKFGEEYLSYKRRVRRWL
jgi:protein-S-isoprenylcysteine O-methyltransferase Ste14